MTLLTCFLLAGNERVAAILHARGNNNSTVTVSVLSLSSDGSDLELIPSQAPAKTSQEELVTEDLAVDGGKKLNRHLKFAAVFIPFLSILLIVVVISTFSVDKSNMKELNMEDMIEDLKKPEALSSDYLEACKDWLELILSGYHMELAGDERIIVFHLYNVVHSERMARGFRGAEERVDSITMSRAKFISRCNFDLNFDVNFEAASKVKMYRHSLEDNFNSVWDGEKSVYRASELTLPKK